MADEYNEDLFEETEYDDSLFEDKEYDGDEEETPTEIPETPISTAEAMLQGGSRGFTFGFSDEIAGATEAAGQALGLKGLGGPITDVGIVDDGPAWSKEKLLEANRSGKKDQLGR